MTRSKRLNKAVQACEDRLGVYPALTELVNAVMAECDERYAVNPKRMGYHDVDKYYYDTPTENTEQEMVTCPVCRGRKRNWIVNKNHKHWTDGE